MLQQEENDGMRKKNGNHNLIVGNLGHGPNKLEFPDKVDQQEDVPDLPLPGEIILKLKDDLSLDEPCPLTSKDHEYNMVTEDISNKSKRKHSVDKLSPTNSVRASKYIAQEVAFCEANSLDSKFRILPNLTQQCETNMQAWNDKPESRQQTSMSFSEQFSENDINDIRTLCKFKTEYQVTVNISFKGENMVIKRVRNPVPINEVLIPLNFRENKNIVTIVGIHFDVNAVFIIMSYAGRTLHEIMNSEKETQKEREEREKERDYLRLNSIQFYYQLCSVIHFLDFHGISHNDVKDENICVTKDDATYIPVLIDFESAHTKQGLPGWKPRCTPEFLPRSVVSLLLKGSWTSVDFYHQKVDFWAISMVLLCLCKNGHPMGGRPEQRLEEDQQTYYKRVLQRLCNFDQVWVNKEGNWLLENIPGARENEAFCQCLSTNFIVSRDEWSIGPTERFLRESGKNSFNDSLDLELTNSVDDKEMDALRKSFQNVGHSRAVRPSPTIREPQKPSTGTKAINFQPSEGNPSRNVVSQEGNGRRKVVGRRSCVQPIDLEYSQNLDKMSEIEIGTRGQKLTGNMGLIPNL